MPETINLHHFEPASRANGPGLRAVLWVQGCTLACPGCFNPQTHAVNGGSVVSIEALADRIEKIAPNVEGLTISGGEPLQQSAAMHALLQRIRRKTALSVVLFSGYRLQEIHSMPGSADLLGLVDVLIAGRYNQRMRSAAGSLLGSKNQRVYYLTGRYRPQDFEQVPQAEIVISPDGNVWISGINPPGW